METIRPIAMQRDDVDKLARATLDALTGVLYDDDGRIAVLTLEKQWASDPSRQGVVITVRPLDPPAQGALALEATRSHSEQLRCIMQVVETAENPRGTVTARAIPRGKVVPKNSRGA